MQPQHVIDLTEQQRIAAYCDGWNDAQTGRPAREGQPIMYQIGFIEASRGVPNRFDAHELEH